MIKPTLFVGLGTTGTEILKTLRQLMAGEFGHCGLPIFRYIAIETYDSVTGDNRWQFKDYERIKMVYATIENLGPVKSKLDSHHPMYNPHFAEWIDPGLLHLDQGLRNGVPNIRMVGRLCLWENWAEIERTLHNAFNAVISANVQQATMEILRQHYEAKNQPIPDEIVDSDGVSVYVFGSLCGGTCSGMMIDMAYYLRNLLGGGPVNNIYGLFTMYDRLLAESTDRVNSVRAANCYASLLELNYYNHTDTVYDVTFPNNRRVNTPQMPYDYAMVVSPTGKLPNIRFISEYMVDENGLNLMVALNLFAETVGDTDGQKNQIRTDWLTYGDYGGRKPGPAGEIPTMTRCLASFGLTAVWYPKYRIASAAACLTGKNLCQNWAKGHRNTVSIKAEATQEWNNIVGNTEILTSPLEADSPSLMEELESILNSATQTFDLITSSDELRSQMDVCPNIGIDDGETPFNIKFAPDGRYYEWMKSKADACKKAFSDAIDKSFENQINNIDFQGTYGIGDVRAFFIELDQIIGREQQRCLSDPPTLNLDQLDFEPMHSADNIWTKLAGNHEEAVKVQRDRLIEEYRQLIIGKEGIYQNLRNYFLKGILEAARAKLGFGVHADDPTIPDDPTIHRQLMQTEENLNKCVQELQENYKYEICPPTYSCVKIITDNPQNSIQTDAQILSYKIRDDITSEDLLFENGNEITMSAFLKREREDIRLQMIEMLRRFALNSTNQDISPVEKIQGLSDIDGGIIRDLARRSNPYQEFTHGYQPFNLSEQGGTKIIIGHDPSETNDSLNDLQNRLYFDRYGNSTIDDFLFFYEEEAGFALDDLAAYDALKHHFEQSPSPYGHWTHQDPHFYDFYDLIFYEKKAKLERWCRALAQLIPEIRQNNIEMFKGIFEYQDETLFFQYEVEDGEVQRLCLTDDASGIKAFCLQNNEANYNNFFKSVIDEFHKLEEDTVAQHVNHLLGQITDREERDVLSDYFNQFLNEIYPNVEYTTSENK